MISMGRRRVRRARRFRWKLKKWPFPNQMRTALVGPLLSFLTGCSHRLWSGVRSHLRLPQPGVMIRAITSHPELSNWIQGQSPFLSLSGKFNFITSPNIIKRQDLPHYFAPPYCLFMHPSLGNNITVSPWRAFEVIASKLPMYEDAVIIWNCLCL